MTDHIQINDVSPRMAYVATGGQAAFSFPFAIFRADDLEVWLDGAKQAGGYAVSGSGISQGGTVLFAAPPAADAQVTLRRNLVIARTTDYQSDGLIRAKTLNDEFDYQVAALQQVAEDVGRAVRRSPTSRSVADLTLPEPAANRSLKWDAGAAALVNSDADCDAVVVAAAASAAAATQKAAEAAAAAASAANSAATLQNGVADMVRGLAPERAPAGWMLGRLAFRDQVGAGQLEDGAAFVAGMVLPYAGGAAPSGWLLCAGQILSRTSYAGLFAAIGTAYGGGDGSATFALPDLRGRVVAGKDDMGGSAASRLTSAGGVSGTTLGAAGGAESHTLTVAQTPSHQHGGTGLTTASAGDHSHGVAGGLGAGSGFILNPDYGASVGTGTAGAHSHTISGSVDATGGGLPHANLPPTLVLNWIIKH